MEGDRSISFLKSVLLPELSPTSIPDDIILNHVPKQEPMTYNVTAVDDSNTGKPVSGIFVFYPNSPNSLLGAYYQLSNVTNTYVFNTTMFTAQELSDNYNYARKTSGLITVRSSTLPAGVYAISGSFNAVTYCGGASEVGLPSYEKVLNVTANNLDKAGNVQVGSGIAILTLPAGYDNTYARLDDRSPSTGPGSTARVRDAQEGLVYTWQVANFNATNLTTWTQIATMNFDCNNACSLVMNVNATYNVLAAITADTTIDFQFQVQALDLTGAEFQQVAFADFTHIIPNGTAIGSYFATIALIGSAPVGDQFLDRPVAALSLQYRAITTIPASVAPVVTLVGNVEAFSAAKSGTQWPISIVSFSGVNSGTVLSVTGVANYELVPNPELAKNVMTTFGKADFAGLQYVKEVFAMRNKLNIRSIWPIDVYRAQEQRFLEICDMNIGREKYHIEAFDWGNLLKIGMNLLPGVADAFLPGSGSVIKGIGGALGLQAASGQPIAASGQPIYAASGQPIYTVAPGNNVLVNAATSGIENLRIAGRKNKKKQASITGKNELIY